MSDLLIYAGSVIISSVNLAKAVEATGYIKPRGTGTRGSISRIIRGRPRHTR